MVERFAAFVPAERMALAKVSLSARALYIALASYADPAGHCHPGQGRLAADLGSSDRSIRNWIDELVANNLVERISRKGKSNTYYLQDSDRKLRASNGDPPRNARSSVPTDPGTSIPIPRNPGSGDPGTGVPPNSTKNTTTEHGGKDHPGTGMPGSEQSPDKNGDADAAGRMFFSLCEKDCEKHELEFTSPNGWGDSKIISRTLSDAEASPEDGLAALVDADREDLICRPGVLAGRPAILAELLAHSREAKVEASAYQARQTASIKRHALERIANGSRASDLIGDPYGLLKSWLDPKSAAFDEVFAAEVKRIELEQPPTTKRDWKQMAAEIGLRMPEKNSDG